MDIQDIDVYIISPHHRLQWEEAQAGYVILFPEGMVKLNSSAGEILSLVDGQRSVADIVSALQTRFPDIENIATDITSMLKLALDKAWLQRIN
ncbi:MAG: pyrroloquinoline quinone biosynthesis peptide chaperone PqqD [Methylophilaceae bacterium]|nr:pyrroloquinoline quinone biosynthesis peptide chaperone PqqD [Methylophilaceae bacterium]